MEPPDRWRATAFAMAGFSATHKILLTGITQRNFLYLKIQVTG
jgi:hypothetical protein